ASLQAALRRQGYSACDFPSVAGYLAASPARLLAVGLEDALEVCDQTNIPGTIDQHPNWRRKLPMELEHIRADPRLGEISRIPTERGRARPTSRTEQSKTIAR